MTERKFKLHESLAYCKQIATSHYENFPVASIFFPKRIRQDIFNIYAFARTADDIADNKDLDTEDKNEQLNYYHDSLVNEIKSDPIFIALDYTFNKHSTLRKVHLENLLKAFKQDVVKEEYDSFIELGEYAKNSANPVGRMILELFNENNTENNELSDKMCSGLQYINFWQDLSEDKIQNRFYVPKDLLEKYNLSLSEFYMGNEYEKQAKIINELIDWTESQYDESKLLIKKVKNIRLKFELFLIWHGGKIILNEVKKMKQKVLIVRPKVNALQIFKYIIFRR